MRLRSPCEHGRYDKHLFEPFDLKGLVSECPGGVFLADISDLIKKALVTSLEGMDEIDIEDLVAAVLVALDGEAP